MRSLLFLGIEDVVITRELISEISGYGFFIGGIILAIMVLDRRMKFRGTCLKIAPPTRWSEFEDYKHFPPKHPRQ